MTLMSGPPALAGRYVTAVTTAGGLQGRVLWCDAEANIWALDSREQVAALADHCKDANINTIVVDVKPLSGSVLYKSQVAPQLKTWQGKPYPADYDLLKTMVEEGHRAGVDVYAAINVFSEGAINRDVPGPAFAHPDWQCIKYEVERWASGIDGDPYPIDAANKAPLPGRMAIITDDKSMPKDIPADMRRAALDACGNVVSTTVGPGTAALAVPGGGCVLIGSGPAGAWLATNGLGGAKIQIQGRPRLVPVAKAADEHFAVFVNPANPDVKAYELSVISEIMKNYEVDGIVMDRMRYPGMYADFSGLSRAAFETWLGGKVERFPEDIFAIDPIPGRDIIRGKYFGKWMEWRSKQIRDFVAEVRTTVKSANPQAKVAAYVGSWYSVYYDVGVNWASPSHQPPYDFAEPSFKETGYADLVDWMCTGCYYQYPTREDARKAGASEGGSVEAAVQESNDVVNDDTFVYGGLYLLQYAKDPAAFEKAISVCNATTQGVMLFDLVYIRDYNWWDMLKRIFASPAQPPHNVPGLIDKVKDLRKTIEESAKH
jgi:uncharacterized lipoprotein YddW (UPF0748 family)